MRGLTHLAAQAATNAGLIADVWSGWSILDSDRFGKLHARLVGRLPEREALPLRQLDARDASRAAVVDLSEDFTRPIVIRGGVAQAEAIGRWGDRAWWLERYPREQVLAADADGSYLWPVAQALSRDDVYISGSAAIFARRPELAAMVETPLSRAVTPNTAGATPVFYQLFLGHAGQGATVHCAMTVNLFRQISGRKKWYFLPPSQTPYLRAKIFTNGYAATSHTLQPLRDAPGSPWFGRLERYTATLEPGDLMINPPWWWHSVENLPGEGLIAGVSTRFRPSRRTVLRSDLFKSVHAFSRILTSEAGVKIGRDQDPLAYERSLLSNRVETDQRVFMTPRGEARPQPE